MAIEKDNNCAGCEYCINCGAGDFYWVSCDECGDDADKFIKYNNEYLCEECFKGSLPKMIVYQPNGSEWELYFYNDAWFCEDDLHEIFNDEAVSEKQILDMNRD